MDGPGPRPDFPVSRCGPCGRDVLTHVRVAAGGEERRCCLHCDAEIDPGELRWVLEPELGRLGYALAEDEEGGEVVGGCGRPGCGRGRCGRG